MTESQHTSVGMNRNEKVIASTVGLIMGIRMLGLFMILPIFTLFAQDYTYVTEQLIGFALGIYGLSQAILQIPFGIASDIWGRKRLILIGLSVFCIGSIIAALSHSIYGLILGRALQGAGAVGSALIALMADLTRPQHRAKAMGIIGMSIAMSFSLAFIVGAIITKWLNLSGIFWLTAGLALFATWVTWRLVPTPPQQTQAFCQDWLGAKWRSQVIEILKNPELIKLNISIFFLHTILTALFVGMPVVIDMLTHNGLLAQTWQFYVPVLVTSLVLTIPMIIFSEKYQRIKVALMTGVGLIIAGLLILWDTYLYLAGCLIGLTLFFTGFNILEATLPSLVSRIAPKGAKGTAISFYTTSQFFGIFVGGAFGGLLYSSKYLNDIFLSLAALATLWLAIIYNLSSPRRLKEITLKLAPAYCYDLQMTEQHLGQLPGIEDVRIDKAAHTATLTIDEQNLNEHQLKPFRGISAKADT